MKDTHKVRICNPDTVTPVPMPFLGVANEASATPEAWAEFNRSMRENRAAITPATQTRGGA